jgi:predicted HTH transcriptional regulator
VIFLFFQFFISCLEYGLNEPIIEEAGDFVGVRLFRDKNSLLENKSENLTDYDQLKVLKFLAENQKITKKETKTLIGVKDTKAKKSVKPNGREWYHRKNRSRKRNLLYIK